MLKHADDCMQRWSEQQMFEEDVRAVVRMLRPNRRERLAGWSEYRTGGTHFRATISWDQAFEHDGAEHRTIVPHLADVLEAMLVGSTRDQDELTIEQECDIYRGILRELLRRVDEIEDSYT